MDPVGNDVRSELHRLGAQSGAGDAADIWTSAVGQAIAANAWPAGEKADGTLVIHVRDSVWGFELTQRASEISAKLPGRPKLQFRVGPLPDEAPSEGESAAPKASPEQEREAEEMAAGIIDPGLRESVAKVIKAALARAPDDRPI